MSARRTSWSASDAQADSRRHAEAFVEGVAQAALRDTRHVAQRLQRDVVETGALRMADADFGDLRARGARSDTKREAALATGFAKLA